MRRVLVLMIFAMLTVSCAHKPTTYEESYKDTHIRDNLYYVSVITNPQTARTVAVEYFYKRANGLCLAQDYPDYRISNMVDTSKMRVSSHSNVIAGTGVVMTQQHTSISPGVAGYVECLRLKK
jgi:hypothetical protein